MIINPYRFGGAAPPSYLSVALGYSPIVLAELADASPATTAVDSSGNGNDLSYKSILNSYQQPTIVTSGNFSCGLADRLVRDAAPLFSQPTAHGWTHKAWIETSALSLNALWAMGDDPGYNVSSSYGSVCYIDAAGKLVFWIYNGAVITAQGSTVLSSGRHFVQTDVDLDNSAINIYLDGALEATAATGGNPPQSFAGYYHLGFCANAAPNGVSLGNFGVYQGQMQFAGVYTSPLGMAAHTALWNAGK